MRNNITSSRILASLVLSFFCFTESDGRAQVVLSIPASCTPGLALTTDSQGQFVCRPLPVGSILPSCRKYSDALTSDGASLSCTTRNNENPAITTALENLEKSELLISRYTSMLNMLMPVVPYARYCGSTANRSTGMLTGNGLVGLAGAAFLCSGVASCGAGAHMCTPYDLYYSVASGVIKQTDQISKAWVYMASWQNFSTSAEEPTAGVSDNCGSYTYPFGATQWYGTAVTWENNAAGDRVLKFYTGPNRTGIGNPVGNYPGVSCAESLFIACCK